MSSREWRLPETLTGLIAGSPYQRNRQPICDAVGVSQAALSQYARGRTTPSLEKAAALAEFFGVTLDHLVHGTPAYSVPVAPPAVLRTVQAAVQDVQASTAAHTALVGRVGRLLADRIDEITREATTEGTEGLVDDGELLRLEARTLRADIVTIDLDANVIAMPDGDSGEGRFLDVVAQALQRGCRYRFVVSSAPRTEDTSVHGFRRLVGERVGDDVVARRCAVRRASVPTLLGMGLYQLDREALAAEDPQILTQFATAVDDDGWFGYLIRPQPESGKDTVMHARRRRIARQWFETLWQTATEIP